jgi:hypothetical protein
MSLQWPSPKDIVLGGTVPPPLQTSSITFSPFNAGLLRKNRPIMLPFLARQEAENRNFSSLFFSSICQKVMELG